jgi:profilin-like protein
MASFTPFVADEEQVPPVDPVSSSESDKEPVPTANWSRRVAAGLAACTATYAVGRVSVHGLALDSGVAPVADSHDAASAHRPVLRESGDGDDTFDSIQLDGYGEASWDGTLEEWVTSEGYCYAAAMAQTSDYAMYAAAPTAGEEGWKSVFADDHEEECLQDDGETEKSVTICEATQLKGLMETGRTPPCGIWLAGNKYTCPQFEKEVESGEVTLTLAFCAKPKGGVHIASTGQNIVAGFYSEEKGQTSGNAKKTVVAFAEYLKGIGY